MNKYTEHNWNLKNVIPFGCSTNYLVGDYVERLGWKKTEKTFDVMVKNLTWSDKLWKVTQKINIIK